MADRPINLAGIGHPLPHVHVVMQRKLRSFLDDQDRLVAIKTDWLYRLCGPDGRAKLAREHGFTPVHQSTKPTYQGMYA